jgi:hypothetical protein
VAYITFTDDIGAATLNNGKPAGANRFSNWVPNSVPVGDAAERDSDGALIMMQIRDDWGATFELRGIRAAVVAGVSMLDVADRLRRHLRRGGQCAVHCEDAADHVYATCGLAPGTTPTLAQTDRRTLEHALSLALINLAGAPTQMICHY